METWLRTSLKVSALTAGLPAARAVAARQLARTPPDISECARSPTYMEYTNKERLKK